MKVDIYELFFKIGFGVMIISVILIVLYTLKFKLPKAKGKLKKSSSVKHQSEDLIFLQKEENRTEEFIDLDKMESIVPLPVFYIEQDITEIHTKEII